MNRRHFLGLAAAFGATCLAACGQAAAPPGTASSAVAKSGGPRWGMTPEEGSAWKQIEAAADKEGAITYYSNGTIGQSQIAAFMDAFKADYPNIKIDLVSGSTADVHSRISTEQDAKSYVGDIADISVRSVLMDAPNGYFQFFVPPAVCDPSAKWSVNVVTDPGIVNDHVTWMPLWINTKMVKPEDVPTHAELVDPKWKGKIEWYSPWQEGGGWNEYYYCKKFFGMDWIAKMQANNPVFANDTAQLLTQLARGEYAILLGTPGSGPATQLIRDGQPIAAVWQDDWVTGSPSSHTIVNGAPHTNAAKVLLNWFMSDPGQRFEVSIGQFPVSATVPPKEDWQKGAAHPKDHFLNTQIPSEAVKAGQAEAGKIFKK
jgi:ABC-type Fe3+ transport system substrate-binding protein